MEKKCSGARCPMNHNFDIGKCMCIENCNYYTPAIIHCEFCGVFPAIRYVDGKLCCVYCETKIEVEKKFSKLQADIMQRLNRIEEIISETR